MVTAARTGVDAVSGTGQKWAEHMVGLAFDGEWELVGWTNTNLRVAGGSRKSDDDRKFDACLLPPCN